MLPTHWHAPPPVCTCSKRITRAAEGVLKQSWLDEKSQDLGSAAWKGRGPLLADVLRLFLARRDDRVEAIAELAQSHIALVSWVLGGHGGVLYWVAVGGHCRAGAVAHCAGQLRG